MPIRSITLVVLACLTMLLLQGWREGIARRDEVHETETSLLNLANSLAQHAEATIEVADTAVSSIVERLETDGTSPEALSRIDRALVSQIAAGARYRDITVIGPDGQWLATSMPVKGDSLADRSYFLRHRADPNLGLFISPPMKARLSGQWMITVSRRFRSAGGSFGGVVFAIIDLSYFVDHYATYELGPNSTISLSLTDGTLLARYPSVERFIGQDISNATVFSKLAQQSSGSYATVALIDGVRRFVGYRRSDKYPLVTVPAMSAAYALHSWRAEMRIHVLVGVVLAGCVGLLGLYLIRQARRSQAAEAQVRDSEARYQLAWQGTGVGMWHWDGRTNTIVFSRRFGELLGYSLDELPRRYEEWRECIHPDDKAATAAMLQAHLNHQAPYDMEYRLMTKSGDWRWFRVNGQAMWNRNGKPVRMAGSLADVTDSEIQRQALKASEEINRSAMEAAVVGMALVAPTGRWLMVNPALCELLGYEAAELLESDYQEIVSGEDLDQSLEMVCRMLAGKPTPHRVELRCVHSSGRIVWVDLSASLVRNPAGAPNYFVWQLQDITERKQIATIQDEFVSTVNHELRTPLSSIYGAVRLLTAKHAGQLDAKGNRLLSVAEQGCTRLENLVNDILDLEKISAGKMDYIMETVDLGVLVREIIDRNIGIAEQYGISFQIRSSSPGVAVRLDPNRFTQSLINLLSNAAKYSPKGGAVTIEIGLAGMDQVRVSVTDRGSGIPEEFRSKIFSRFAQADSSATRKVGGSGLGLNITKRIIEAFGGVVTFDTAEGIGTTFHFTLPICTAAMVEHAS